MRWQILLCQVVQYNEKKMKKIQYNEKNREKYNIMKIIEKI